MDTTPRNYYRLALGLAVLSSAFLVLGAGALGIIGGGEADRVYLGVLAVGLAGAVVSRLRAPGMALTLAAMALAQVLAPAVAFAAVLPGTSGASVVDVVGLTAMYAALFAASAWLFSRARGGSSAPSPSRSAAGR